MKQIIVFLSLLTLVACQNDSPKQPTKYKTIMIKASGEVETLPNKASFYVDLSCLDKSIKVSKKCLVDKSNKLIDELHSLGIDKDDILTTAVNLRRSYTWTRNSRVFEGYKSSTNVFVTVKDIDSLDEIYTDLLGNRNLNIGGLNYAHSKMDSLKNEAYVNALKKANILADKLLDNLPEKKKEVLKIGNVKISASLPQSNNSKLQSENMVNRESDISKSKSISMSKGTVKVTATLYVEYQIK